jgi:hypothetical protein
MSSADALDLGRVPWDSREALRQRLRALGARPFHQQVVQSPWSTVYDVDLLHQEAKGLLAAVVDGCEQPDAIRCLTVSAPSGYGKTHLLAWTRQQLEQSQKGLFAYIPPYSPDSGPFENHVLRAVLESLRLRSPRHLERLNAEMRSFLVGNYDAYILARRPLGRLKTGTLWSRILRPLSHRIGGKDPDDQFAALQRAFRYRDLLEFAFNRFTERHPPGADGLRADWDTFVAVALTVCGNTTQRWHAERWLQNEPMPPEVWAPYHFQHRCQGTDKIRNVLFSLTHLIGCPVCLAFDQLEDTCNAVLKQPGPPPWDPLTLLLVRLSSVPRFTLLFFIQASVWGEIRSQIPPMLHDRITEGHGVQRLRSLDDRTAQAVLRARMDAFVWEELAAEKFVPPGDQPLFPFTAEEVRQLRIHANSELRPFLRLLQDRYEQLITPTPPPAPVITEVIPSQVVPHEPTAVRIHGRHFRPEVAVFLAGRPITPITCHVNDGQTEVIEITTPVGHLGAVELRVQAADDPQRFATAQLTFVDTPPRPYWRYVGRDKFKARRRELGMTQGQLGKALQEPAWKVGNFENDHWQAPDEFIERLARALGRTVADFRKDAPGDAS